jgi:ribosomal protein S18 acetylase RimI-like enzyme
MQPDRALDIRTASELDPDVLELRAALDAEVLERYSDVEGFVASGPHDAPQSGDALLVAYEGGRAVALGGLRSLGATIGEIKHVYVVTGARRRGIASRLLDELEARARKRGYRKLRLDTGARQHEAVELYRSRGFEEISPYNSNVGVDVWMEKRL